MGEWLAACMAKNHQLEALVGGGGKGGGGKGGALIHHPKLPNALFMSAMP